MKRYQLQKKLFRVIYDAICGNGSISEKHAKNEIRITVKGLHRNTAYKVYVVAKDNAMNISTGKTSPNVSEVAASENTVVTKNEAMNISDSSISARISGSTYYTGSEVRPDVVLKFGDRVLKEGEDYSISYDNNINVAGKESAAIIVKGIGDYTGERVIKFTIKYLNAEKTYTIKGEKDKNGTYKTAKIIPAKGYMLYDVNESENVNGIKKVSFRIKRKLDGAVSDIITINVKTKENNTEETTENNTQETKENNTEETTENNTGVTTNEITDDSQQTTSVNGNSATNAANATNTTETSTSSGEQSSATDNKESVTDNKEIEKELTSEEKKNSVKSDKKDKRADAEEGTMWIIFVISGVVILVTGFLVLLYRRKKENE